MRASRTCTLFAWPMVRVACVPHVHAIRVAKVRVACVPHVHAIRVAKSAPRANIAHVRYTCCQECVAHARTCAGMCDDMCHVCVFRTHACVKKYATNVRCTCVLHVWVAFT